MPNNPVLQENIQQEIEGLAFSISEIVSKFKELHHPIQESSDKVPQATEQLDKISEQTEAATHQMLNGVEKIVEQLEDAKTGLNQIKTCVSEDRVSEIDGLVDNLLDKASVSCNDAYAIMDALQFQDITTQQVNHAASMLEEIEKKLHGVMSSLRGEKFESSEPESGNEKKKRAFDPRADLFDKKTDQSAIDDLFAKKT